MQLLVVTPPDAAVLIDPYDWERPPGWTVANANSYREAMVAVGKGCVDAVIAAAPKNGLGSPTDDRDFESFLHLVDAQRIAGIVVSPDQRTNSRSDTSLLETVSHPVPPDELRGRLAMIHRYHDLVRRLERELINMQRLGKRLNHHFQEIDQEMRLAGRLQQDFLPKLAQPIGNLRFASLYKPASWVSGDIFDVFRIDEHHTGFYIADAVGHGMAAGLLTMFINRAVTPKRVTGERYTVLSPSDVLTGLNDAIASQSLPHCQFITACYGLFNHRDNRLTLSRGGHPYPLLLTREGAISEIKAPGGLIGVFAGEEFPSVEVLLREGDKVLLYTDGAEQTLGAAASTSDEAVPLRPFLQPLVHRPARELLSALEHIMETQTKGADPRDDLTFLAIECLA